MTIAKSSLTVIIPELGIESIKPLSEVGVDFSKLDNWYIAIVIAKLGFESIKPLSEVGADFSKLASSNIRNILLKSGIESIKPLSEVGVDFSKLDNWDIAIVIAELGSESIKPLSEVGTDFSQSDKLVDILSIVNKFGVENTKKLYDFGSAIAELGNAATQMITKGINDVLSKFTGYDSQSLNSEIKSISLYESLICENEGFNYADICYENDISENCLSCGQLGNLSEDYTLHI